MRRLIPAAAALSALSLAACEPAENGGGLPPVQPTPTVELGGVDLAGDVNLLGTEPFWGVEMTGGRIRIAGVDRPEMTAPRTSPAVQGTTATWTTTTDDGQPLVITVMDTDCSDGMSDRTYPLTARVQIGMETLNGCGAASDFIRNTDEQGNPRAAEGAASQEGEPPAG